MRCKVFFLCCYESWVAQERKRWKYYLLVYIFGINSDDLSRNVLISNRSFLKACVCFCDRFVRRYIGSKFELRPFASYVPVDQPKSEFISIQQTIYLLLSLNPLEELFSRIFDVTVI